MLTKHFKNIMAVLLATRGGTNNAPGLLPVKNASNVTYFASGNVNSTWPQSVTWAFQTSATTAGIAVGSGTTAATEDDYNLESQITSGLSGTVVNNMLVDGSGNPYAQFDVALSNNSQSAITVSEIGYRQSVTVTTTLGGTSRSSAVVLFDRTVLETPVTIAAGGSAVIRYILKTLMSGSGGGSSGSGGSGSGSVEDDQLVLSGSASISDDYLEL